MVKTRKHRNYKRGGLWNPFAKKPTDPQQQVNPPPPTVNPPPPTVNPPTPTVNPPTPPPQCMFNGQNIIDMLNVMNTYAYNNIQKYETEARIDKTWDESDKYAYFYIKYISTENTAKSLNAKKTKDYIDKFAFAVSQCSYSVKKGTTIHKIVMKALSNIGRANGNFNKLFYHLLREETEKARAKAKATAMPKGGKRKTKKTRKTQKKSRKC